MFKIKIISITKVPYEVHKEMQKWIKNETYQDYQTMTISLPKCHLSQYGKRQRSPEIRKQIIQFLKYLNKEHETPRILFPSRSEFVRCAVLFANLSNGDEVIEKKEVEVLYNVIRRLESPKSKPKIHKKPKKLLKVYQYDINKNLIISFLNELNGDMKNAFELAEITGMHDSMIRHTTNLILKDYPELIKKYPVGRGIVYKLNREELKRVMEVI